MAGCLPILLARTMEPDGVLYPLKVLGFEVIALQSWRELLEKLLELAEDLADRPGVRACTLPSPSNVQSRAVPPGTRRPLPRPCMRIGSGCVLPKSAEAAIEQAAVTPADVHSSTTTLCSGVRPEAAAQQQAVGACEESLERCDCAASVRIMEPYAVYPLTLLRRKV